MKKIILSLLILIFLPLTMALSGGDTWLYHFDKCDKLRVDITANQTIDEGEYTILNECEGENNSFICNCSDDFYFNVSFKTNTVNNYTFSFNYDYSGEVVEETTEATGGSNGGGGVIFKVRLEENKKFNVVLLINTNSDLWIGDTRHTMKMVEVKEDWIRVEIKSDPIVIDLYVNETKVIEIDNKLLEIHLKEIKRKVAYIYLRILEKEEAEPTIEDEEVIYIANEIAIVGELPEEVEEPKEYVGELADEPEKKGLVFFIIVAVIVILYIILYFTLKVYSQR